MAALTAGLTALQTIVVAGFAYSLTGKLDQSMRERALAVDHAKAMSDLVAAVASDASTAQARDRDIQHLAMFGIDAIAPLAIMAASPNPYPPEAALRGLRSIALAHRQAVCDVVRQALATPQLVQEVRRAPMVEFDVSICQAGKGDRP